MSSTPSLTARLGARLALLAVGGFLGLGGAEAVLRLVAPQPGSSVTPGIYAATPQEWPRYALRPGYTGRVTNFVEFDTQVAVTEEGLRAPVRSAPSATLRLLTVGDSFAFGWGVEGGEAFPIRTAELLGRPGQPVVGLNGGVPGFGLLDAVGVLEHRGPALRPDFVVVAVFPGNDLVDATDKHGSVRVEDGLVTGFGGTRGWKDRLDAGSHLFRLTKRALGPTIREVLGRGPTWEQAYLRDVVRSYRREPGELLLEGRERTRAAGLRLPELIAATGATRALAVLMPGPLGADPDRFDRALRSFGLDPADYSQDVPGAWFAALFHEVGLDVVDLGPAFRAGVEAGRPLFFRHDPHWTVEGHELAAREIAERIEEVGWLEAFSESRELRGPGEGGEPASTVPPASPP